jgi:hypothetical protein
MIRIMGTERFRLVASNKLYSVTGKDIRSELLERYHAGAEEGDESSFFDTLTFINTGEGPKPSRWFRPRPTPREEAQQFASLYLVEQAQHRGRAQAFSVVKAAPSSEGGRAAVRLALSGRAGSTPGKGPSLLGDSGRAPPRGRRRSRSPRSIW